MAAGFTAIRLLFKKVHDRQFGQRKSLLLQVFTSLKDRLLACIDPNACLAPDFERTQTVTSKTRNVKVLVVRTRRLAPFPSDKTSPFTSFQPSRADGSRLAVAVAN